MTAKKGQSKDWMLLRPHQSPLHQLVHPSPGCCKCWLITIYSSFLLWRITFVQRWTALSLYSAYTSRAWPITDGHEQKAIPLASKWKILRHAICAPDFLQRITWKLVSDWHHILAETILSLPFSASLIPLLPGTLPQQEFLSQMLFLNSFFCGPKDQAKC